jgi:hypothetical protein
MSMKQAKKISARAAMPCAAAIIAPRFYATVSVPAA